MTRETYIRLDRKAKSMDTIEKIIIMRMYKKGFIAGNCRPLELVAKAIHWEQLQERYNIHKSFKRVIRHMTRRFIDDHGSSLEVISLNKNGFKMAIALQSENFREWIESLQ